MNGYNRRDFLKRAAAGTVAVGMAHLSTEEADAGERRNRLPLRTLGKTGEKVSMLGFGGGSRFLVASEEEASAMLERALAAGITYFDTASSYGRDRASEKRYGRVLPRYRKQIFLATKTGDRSYDGAMRSVEESLKALNTDFLDLIQMHDVGPSDRPENWTKTDGALTALRKLKDQKVVRYVGFTGHQKAEVHQKVIESLEFDTVLMALNAAEHRPFRQIALPAAKAKGMGVIAMKATRGLVGEGPGKAPPKDLLSWVFELPVATLLVGMESLAMLNDNLRIARAFKPGAAKTALLTEALSSHVTAEQLGWAMPDYRDVCA